MSQSGVSRAIARLEARLGVRLLERTTRTVALSEEGRRLYEQIVPLLAGLEEVAASVATAKDAVRGTLRVICTIYLAAYDATPIDGSHKCHQASVDNRGGHGQVRRDQPTGFTSLSSVGVNNLRQDGSTRWKP